MIIIIYFLGAVALAIEMDKTDYNYYTFSDRLNIMLFWPVIIILFSILWPVCILMDLLFDQGD